MATFTAGKMTFVLNLTAARLDRLAANGFDIRKAAQMFGARGGVMEAIKENTGNAVKELKYLNAKDGMVWE